ncbi:MAG: SH3 domain-containing protein, partial [Erysipelotrichaceae bacterium]|nr:SH3 domain-containing protein [Erysipelotrichaceae bacterium]
YKKKGSYKEGDKVYVMGTSGSWSKLDNGYYVFSSYLKKMTYPYKAITTETVNYRTGPDVSYTKKGQYKAGVKIIIVSRKGDWVKMDNGYYMFRDYTKKR